MNRTIFAFISLSLIYFSSPHTLYAADQKFPSIRGNAVLNLSEIENSTGISRLTAYINNLNQSSNLKHTIKIAIVGNGFAGFNEELGRSLPPSPLTVYHPPTDEEGHALPSSNDNHDLVMAQIITSLITHGGHYADTPFSLHLYEATGYSVFERALKNINMVNQAAISRGEGEIFDIVVYSQIWDYGGNGDGEGFINHLVNIVTKNSPQTIWINSASDFEETTYSARIQNSGADQYVDLPGPRRALTLRCKTLRCPLRLVLQWNAFENNIDRGTNKDLDLELFDAQNPQQPIKVSALKQVLAASSSISNSINKSAPAESLFPREIIELELRQGNYFVRVVNNSGSLFSPYRDRMKIIAEGEGLEMPEATHGDNLLNPADNPDVITVGAIDTSRTSYNTDIYKPDIWTVSKLTVDMRGQISGAPILGSSNSAAITAAGIALARSVFPKITRDELVNKITIQTNINSNVPWQRRDIGMRRILDLQQLIRWIPVPRPAVPQLPQQLPHMPIPQQPTPAPIACFPPVTQDELDDLGLDDIWPDEVLYRLGLLTESEAATPTISEALDQLFARFGGGFVHTSDGVKYMVPQIDPRLTIVQALTAQAPFPSPLNMPAALPPLFNTMLIADSQGFRFLARPQRYLGRGVVEVAPLIAGQSICTH